MSNNMKIPTASIISIGTEIIYGNIDDTNATFLSKWLKQSGIKVIKRTTVDDNIDSIIEALKDNEKSDIVFLTGGLGPTHDDITRDSVAKYLGKKLIFSEKQWEIIQQFFKSKSLSPTASNKRQAYYIDGGEFLQNIQGTAPGLFIENNNKLFFLLPGPPVENQPLIYDDVKRIFTKRNLINNKLKTASMRIYNTGESYLTDILKDKLNRKNIGIYFKKEGWIEIQITKVCNNCAFDELKEIALILKENNIYYTQNIDLKELLLNTLKEKGLTIAFAESITGGKLASSLVEVPGASNSLLGGVVAYNNDVKQNLLDVKESTLKNYGAVSKQTVTEMAAGLKKIIPCDIAVSISGLAGPSGGTDTKPIGTVFFGFLFENKEFYSIKKLFVGNRERIIKKCVNFTYLEILKHLENANLDFL